MNARRYRFSTTLGVDNTIANESRATLDAAILRAKELSADYARVWLVDCESPPFITRGMAEGGKFTWLKPCHACRGTGQIVLRAQRVPGAPATKPKKEDCARCHGSKVVLDT